MSDGDWRALLRELIEFGVDFGVFRASTDLEKQIREYRCHGCKGAANSTWPAWTLLFEHERGCRYLALLREIGMPADSTEPGRGNEP